MVSWIINVDRPTKRFYKKAVVSDVSFAIPSGSIRGLVGPNGTGKQQVAVPESAIPAIPVVVAEGTGGLRRGTDGCDMFMGAFG